MVDVQDVLVVLDAVERVQLRISVADVVLVVLIQLQHAAATALDHVLHVVDHVLVVPEDADLIAKVVVMVDVLLQICHITRAL